MIKLIEYHTKHLKDWISFLLMFLITFLNSVLIWMNRLQNPAAFVIKNLISSHALKIFHEQLPLQVGLLISFVESKLLLINIIDSIAFHERNVWPIGATTPIRRRVPRVARSHARSVYPPSLGSRGMICSEASIIEDHTERKENPRPDRSGGTFGSVATRLFNVHCAIRR